MLACWLLTCTGSILMLRITTWRQLDIPTEVSSCTTSEQLVTALLYPVHHVRTTRYSTVILCAPRQNNSLQHCYTLCSILSPLVLLLSVVLLLSCVHSTGGMTLTREKHGAVMETSPHATLYTPHLTWHDLGTNPALLQVAGNIDILQDGDKSRVSAHTESIWAAAGLVIVAPEGLSPLLRQFSPICLIAACL
jgi:hypothetical protein